MTGARISIQIDDQEIQAGLHRLAGLTKNFTPLMRAIGTGLAEVTRKRFDQARDPAGLPWAPLNPAYAATKRGPGILRESGMRGGLQGSITFQTSGMTVEVGTNKVYGAIHQFGGTIKPKKGKFLVFRMGGRPVFARSVTIPARPFLGFGAADRDMVLDVVDSQLQRLLGS